MKGRRRDHHRRDTGPSINNAIKAHECRLIGEDRQYGIVSMDYARQIANETGLDLVEISPNAKPPVVKLIDYGKFKYDQQKKANEAKKKQANVQLKEIQFRPNIDVHDLETKLKRADRFFLQGDKVKVVMQFRGREMAYKESRLEKFHDILGTLVDFGATVENEPKMVGNRIIAILAPDKKIMARRRKEIEGDKSSAETE